MFVHFETAPNNVRKGDFFLAPWGFVEVARVEVRKSFYTITTVPDVYGIPHEITRAVGNWPTVRRPGLTTGKAVRA